MINHENVRPFLPDDLAARPNPTNLPHDSSSDPQHILLCLRSIVSEHQSTDSAQQCDRVLNVSEIPKLTAVI